MQSFSWTREVFIAMTTHCDKPEVLQAACNALLELIDFCPVVLDELGDEPDDLIPLHRCGMAVLILHVDDAELCQRVCQVLSSIMNHSSPLREVTGTSILYVL